MNISDFRSLCASKNLKPVSSGPGFTAKCPGHDDSSPSLSVTPGADGRILLHCHAGCGTTRILDALGLKIRDLFPPRTEPYRPLPVSRPKTTVPRATSPPEPPETGSVDSYDTIQDALRAEFDRVGASETGDEAADATELPLGTSKRVLDPATEAPDPSPEARTSKLGAVEAVYPYVDEDGVLIFEVVRYKPKTFRQRVPVLGMPGRYRWSTTGVRKPLYRLPEVLDAVRDGNTVFVVEGEKDADRLVAAGVTATTNAGGAGKFGDEHAASLSGARVLVIADKDIPGIAHAELVRGKLTKVGVESVRVVVVPDIPRNPAPGWTPGTLKDASDFLDAGGTVVEIENQPDISGTKGTQGTQGTKTPPPPPPKRPLPGNGPTPGSPAPGSKLQAPGSSPNLARIRSDLLDVLLAIRADEEMAAERKNILQGDEVVLALGRLGNFYHDADLPTIAGCYYFNSDQKTLLAVTSDRFGCWLSLFTAVSRATKTWAFLQRAIETEALSGPTTTAVCPERYFARREVALPGTKGTQGTQGAAEGNGVPSGPVPTTTVFYLSNGDGAMVRVDAGSVRLVDNGEDGVLFACGKTLSPWQLGIPCDPFSVCNLFGRARTTSAVDSLNMKMWIASLPTIPKNRPPALFVGDIGSGKTKTACGIAELYGLPVRAERINTEGESDFRTTVNDGGLVVLDNVDGRVRWLPDCIAAMATGAGSTKRTLFEDTELTTLKPRAWLAITSARPQFAGDAGIADRLVVIGMTRSEEPSQDEELTEEILRHRNGALSFIVHALRRALADTAIPPEGLNSRFPNYGRMAWKLGRALGHGNEEIEAALQSSERDKSALCLDNDPVLVYLADLLREAPDGVFEGTAKELGVRLAQVDPDLERDGLLKPRTLTRKLKANWAHLQKTYHGTRTENRDHVMVYTLRRQESEDRRQKTEADQTELFTAPAPASDPTRAATPLPDAEFEELEDTSREI